MYVGVKIKIKDIKQLDYIITEVTMVNKVHPNVIKELNIEVRESKTTS